MHPVVKLSVPEQTAAHLREGMRTGRWSGTLPGVKRLAEDLDVSRNTLRAALRQLEAEGLLGGRGTGRSRGIMPHGMARRRLRVGILLHDKLAEAQSKNLQLYMQIGQSLDAAGHEVIFAGKTQVQLHHDAGRVAHHVNSIPADAWIVVAGSREVLEWFARQPLPCLALFGRTGDLPLARTGPDGLPGYLEATRRLLALGHRRIVVITRRIRRHPTPGRVERAVLTELAAHGVATGPYHLPDWEETPAGYSKLLESLFRHTPPTAMIIDEVAILIATMEFLARRRIHVPEQVSLVSTTYEESLAWCHPTIAHLDWDNAPIARRVLRWVAAVRKGRADRKTINYPAKFVAGGSIGPVGGEISDR